MAKQTSAEVYRRADGLWDWRVKAANGEIVVPSGGQGFTERNDAVKALLRVGVILDSLREIRDV